jgi:hypothetical protein
VSDKGAERATFQCGIVDAQQSMTKQGMRRQLTREQIRYDAVE